MKRFKLLLTTLLLTASPAYAEFRHFNEWTGAEKRLFLTYNTMSYIDHRQTRVGLRNGFVEKNPLYGKNPHRDKSIAINVLVNGGLYYLVGSSNPDKVNALVLGGIVARTAVVYNNDQLGISWKVAF